MVMTHQRRHGLENEFLLSLSRSPLSKTIFFLQIFLTINIYFYRCYLIIGVVSRRITMLSTVLGKCQFHVIVLRRTVEKPTRVYFPCAVLLFCSLTPLFCGVLYDVAIVVFLNSLLNFKDIQREFLCRGFLICMEGYIYEVFQKNGILEEHECVQVSMNMLFVVIVIGRSGIVILLNFSRRLRY